MQVFQETELQALGLQGSKLKSQASAVKAPKPGAATPRWDPLTGSLLFWLDLSQLPSTLYTSPSLKDRPCSCCVDFM